MGKLKKIAKARALLMCGPKPDPDPTPEVPWYQCVDCEHAEGGHRWAWEHMRLFGHAVRRAKW